MDILEELIGSLSPGEQKELEKRLQHRHGYKENKEQLLFHLAKQQPKLENDEIVRRLYELNEEEPISHNTLNTYRQWRLLLTEQIVDFCFSKVIGEDIVHQIVRYLMVARFLFNRKKYKLAYKYLHKAEQIALKEEQHFMLQRIYSLQIEYSWANPEINTEILTKNWKQNIILTQKEASLNVSLNLIRQRLKEAHRTGQSLDVDVLTAEVLREYGMDDEVKNNANMLYKLIMIVLTVMEEKKDFAGLTKYLVKNIQHMEQAQMFNQYNHYIKIEILTAICRSSIKCNKYKMTEQYLMQLKKEHDLHPGYSLLNTKRIMIQFDLLQVTNRLGEATQYIHKIENSHLSPVAEEDDYFFCTLNPNLISCNFFSGNFAVVKKYLTRLLNSEKRFKNYWGQGALICLHLSDCMIHIELGDMEYVITKLKAIQERFSKVLKQPENIRYKLYLKILREIALNPIEKDFKESANTFLKLKEPELGSPEFLPFAPYVLSKLQNRSYYEVFLELANK